MLIILMCVHAANVLLLVQAAVCICAQVGVVTVRNLYVSVIADFYQVYTSLHVWQYADLNR